MFTHAVQSFSTTEATPGGPATVHEKDIRDYQVGIAADPFAGLQRSKSSEQPG
jgi:hypothetical protein